MNIANTAIQKLSGRLPKVISPRTHAVIDYAVAGSFFVMGAMFWRRNKRAALASFLCGGATVGTSMLTDYPGGVKKVISFPTHGKIDAGLAGLTAMMPNVLAFGDEPEAKFFRMQAVGESVVAGLTDFQAYGDEWEREYAA